MLTGRLWALTDPQRQRQGREIRKYHGRDRGLGKRSFYTRQRFVKDHKAETTQGAFLL